MSAPVPGIPPEARALFERLVAEPLRDVDEVRQQVIAYTATFDPLTSRGSESDPIVVIRISRTCIALLEGIGDSVGEEERHLVQAACRYFVIEDDAVNDRAKGGLDDDREVVNAVARHLGRADLVIEGSAG